MLEPHCLLLPCAVKQILRKAVVLRLEREKAPRTGMPTTYATEAIATIVVSSLHKAPELIFPYALFVAISVGAQHSGGGEGDTVTTQNYQLEI